MQTYIKICDFYARHIRKKQFFLEEIYAYYVMSSRKMSGVNMFCLLFAIMSSILII